MYFHQTLLLALLSIGGIVAAEDAKSYTDDATFKQSMLDTTNDARQAHNASRLSWNETLAEFAEEWSGKCGFKHSVRLTNFFRICGELCTTCPAMWIKSKVVLRMCGSEQTRRQKLSVARGEDKRRVMRNG